MKIKAYVANVVQVRRGQRAMIVSSGKRALPSKCRLSNPIEDRPIENRRSVGRNFAGHRSPRADYKRDPARSAGHPVHGGGGIVEKSAHMRS